MKIILSIKPEFVKEIFEGRKRYEYRKAIFTKNVDSVIIYSTMPVGKFVGEFTIDGIVQEHPDKLWKNTKKASGISKDFFDTYFKDREKGYALRIGKVKEYSKPLNPLDVIEHFIAPQSFRYVNDDILERYHRLLAI